MRDSVEDSTEERVDYRGPGQMGSQRQYCRVVNNLGLRHYMSLAFSS